MLIFTSFTTRGRAVAARRAHNPEVVGSNPTPATKENTSPLGGVFSLLGDSVRTHMMTRYADKQMDLTSPGFFDRLGMMKEKRLSSFESYPRYQK